MKVSARDRRHFEAIRRVKALERAERQRDPGYLNAVDSMREGLELADVASDSHIEALLDARALGQAELSRRARVLGLRERS